MQIFLPFKFCQYHLHDTHVQKAIKWAVRKTKIAKLASAHTFGPSYESHLMIDIQLLFFAYIINKKNVGLACEAFSGFSIFEY
jgi:hypothetical protein